ncbi:MAG TPA: hypothetical protein VK766_08970 [Cytophagaceae bacterium]|jgi:hypothetical protein|nr:hypothetical protein [Cytophagaceae bacterium]
MKFLEKVLIVLAFIGLLVRALMWQGGEIFLTVALPSLSILYLLMSWSVFKDKNHGHNIFLSMMTGLSFSIAVIGILFKLLLWKGGDTILIAGLMVMAISKIIGLLLKWKYADALENYFKNLFLRYYIIAGITLIVFLIPSKTIVFLYHRDDPQYVTLYLRYFNEPSNMKYREDFFRYRSKKYKQKWNVKEYHEYTNHSQN